jgi:hypothetical protein
MSHTQMQNDYSDRPKVNPIRPPVQQQHQQQQQIRQKEIHSGHSMTSDLDQRIASVKKVWNDPASPGIPADMTGDHHPAISKSPAIRNQYPPAAGPIGMGYGMGMSSDSMSLQMNSMKQQMQSSRQSQQQQQPLSQYQRSLSGHYMTSNSPPVNMMNQMASPPPLDAMRQDLSQHHQQQQQQHYVQQQQSGAGHGPSIPTPPVTHPMYNMATIANMYSPAFNQHMDPRASVQLQAFAQQLAFHQNQQNQHPMRSAVQAASAHPVAGHGHGSYGHGAAAPQMPDYRNMGQVSAAVGQHQPQHPAQQQQQSNLMKSQHQYMQSQQSNFQFWNR